LDQETKAIFELARKNKVLDYYILLGWFFNYFHYLDKKWTMNRVNEILTLDDAQWFAFFDSYCVAEPSPDEERYHLLYPHFERYNSSKIKNTRSHDDSYFLHLIAYYFYQLETIDSNGLLSSFLRKADKDNMIRFINVIWRQESYYTGLENENDILQFEKQILDIWKYIFYQYKELAGDDAEEIIAELSHLLGYIPRLTATNTELILASSKVSEKRYETHLILENLVRLKSAGVPTETASYLGAILDSFQFYENSTITDEELLVDLVRFLYLNGQKPIADRFCDSIARLGFTFLTNLRNEFNQ
jgi:hypothetical protein